MPTIEDLRLAKRWSQADLAQKSGVSPSTISHIERGKPTTEETIARLCEALEANPSEVTGWTEFVPVLHRGRRQRRKKL